MKLNLNIPLGLKQHFEKEVEEFRQDFAKQYYQEAWRHLERAHILGQAYPIEHTSIHWKMLKFGMHMKNWQEVIGQIPRLLVGGVKSFVGKIPVGNTGGANVPALKPMEIPNDLQLILNHYKDKCME